MPRTEATEFDAIYPRLISNPGADEYQSAWREFWSAYEPKIRQWGREHKLESNQVDEVVGELMLKLVKSMPTFQYDSEKGFSPWLRRVTHNLIVDLWTRQARSAGRGGTEAFELLNQQPKSEVATNGLESILGTALDEFLARVRLDAEATVRANVKPATWLAYQLLEKEKLTGKQAAEQTGLTVVGVFTARGRVKQKVEAEIMKLGTSRELDSN